METKPARSRYFAMIWSALRGIRARCLGSSKRSRPKAAPMTQRSYESSSTLPGKAAPHRSSRIWFNSCFGSITDAEISAVRMMEHHRADASFRVHHHPFGQLHADFFRLQKLPEADLVVEVGASRISKAVALPAITRSETLGHVEFRRIRKAPIFADPTMQPLRASFRGLDSQGLQPVRFEVVALVFCPFAALANAFTGGNYK